ncbi:hypothetical protein BAJUN_01180 [Bajunvirus bajun]|uniref:Uncharacterized protein n=1 Tax=Brevundimonas phage vB_BgoS-Bajun TaxID=2948594 RepID=A0A9E7SRL1_9CAUD|nr:hypothetical protein BAJUN_01180 [Brevundimonas phage vB_BgoS-Bajun]
MTERFEQVATEFAHGQVVNADYGSQVRVLLRSPDAVLFTGVGLNLWSPRKDYSGALKSLTFARVTKAVLANEKIVAAIDAAFGDGAAAWAMKAWTSKGVGTILIDGGGAALPLPRPVQSKLIQARHAAVTPDWRADLTGQIKTCLQCGENLSPVVSWHRFGYDENPIRPKTLADCQRLTNHQVVSIHGYDTRYPDREHEIEAFTTWDGETLHDPYFCHGGRCAAAYGRRFAQAVVAGAVPALPADGSAVPEHDIAGVRSDVDHYEKKPRFIDGFKV